MKELARRNLLRVAILGALPSLGAIGALALAAFSADRAALSQGGLLVLMAVVATLTLALSAGAADLLGAPGGPLGDHAKAAAVAGAITLAGMAVVVGLIRLGAPPPGAGDSPTVRDWTVWNYITLSAVLFAVPQSGATFGRLRGFARWERFLLVLILSGVLTIALVAGPNRLAFMGILLGVDVLFLAYLEGADALERWCASRWWREKR